MKNKTSLLLATLCLLMISCASGKPENPTPPNTEKKVSIIGDSYSSYKGYLTPESNVPYYGTPDGEATDLRDVEQMWWHLLIDQLGYKLERNNSYSGSTICNTGYDGGDFTEISFITRMRNLGAPDIILIFGGTNDDWSQAPLGEYKYEDWTREELYKFRPGCCYMMAFLKRAYPKAQIYNITNSELSDAVTYSMEEICKHYGVTNILLKDIEKQANHPTIKGMTAICEQVKKVILEK